MRALLGRVRLLPLVIVAIVTLTGSKVWTLATGRAMLASAGQAVVPAAQAASVPEKPTPEKPGPHATSKPVSPPAAKPEPAPPAEPAVSEAERTLLQDLRARRAELDSREAGVQSREAVLGATEKRLTARVDELQALQTRLEALDHTRRERDESNWRSLVKTYEAMRPRDAAAIFNELDQPVLIQVLDRMKEAKAAPVLAAMLPDRARTATTELAKWRTRIPGEPAP